MGLFSSSSKSTSLVTNVVTTKDDRVGAADDATVIQVQEGASLDISNTDAAEVIGVTLTGFQEALSEVLGVSERERAQTIEFTEEALNLAASTAAPVFKPSDLLKLAVIAVLGVVAFRFGPKLLRG